MLVGSRGHHLSPSRYGRAPDNTPSAAALYGLAAAARRSSIVVKRRGGGAAATRELRCARPPSLLCPVSSLCARCWPLLRIAIACFALRSRLIKAILEPVLFAVSSLGGAICVGLFVGIRTVPYSCVRSCAVWPQHVVFTAHLRKRTIALRAADGLSVHRVCVPCCTVAPKG